MSDLWVDIFSIFAISLLWKFTYIQGLPESGKATEAKRRAENGNYKTIAFLWNIYAFMRWINVNIFYQSLLLFRHFPTLQLVFLETLSKLERFSSHFILNYFTNKMCVTLLYLPKKSMTHIFFPSMALKSFQTSQKIYEP